MLANAWIELPDLGQRLDASIFVVNGRLFSVNCRGGANYFEELLGMDPQPRFRVYCELLENLDTRLP